MRKNKPHINCNKCGECCRGFSEEKSVVLFPRDLEVIPTKMRMDVQEFQEKYCNVTRVKTKIEEINLYTLKYKLSKCIFLNDNLCEIYDYRPIQCQRAPFSFFWNGFFDYQYECLQGVCVPEGWSSEKYDNELLSSLFQSIKMR